MFSYIFFFQIVILVLGHRSFNMTFPHSINVCARDAITARQTSVFECLKEVFQTLISNNVFDEFVCVCVWGGGGGFTSVI